MSPRSRISWHVWRLSQGNLIHHTTLVSRVFHPLYNTCPKGISSIIRHLSQGNLICRTTLGSRGIHSPFVKSHMTLQPPLQWVIWPCLAPHSLSYNPCVKGFSFAIRHLGSRDFVTVGWTLCQGKIVAERCEIGASYLDRWQLCPRRHIRRGLFT